VIVLGCSYMVSMLEIPDANVFLMLPQIKVTKLNNYEENYKERIESARDEEHALLRRELAWWAVSLVVTVTSPVLASAGTFATFVLVSEDNILTSAQTFTVLLLFIALRFPISYTGRLIGKASQALDSLRRIDEFVGRELRPEQSKDSDQNVSNEPEAPSEKDDDSPVLVVKNGVFRFGRSEPLESETLGESTQTSRASKSIFGFEVSGIDFSLRRGQVLAVVGPVGSGKSTLINGIMGEVPSTPDTHVSTKGTVAYVSQTAFILNETVRANILFGLRYDDEWYNKVLDACCLRPDLEQLGEAGDLAEIGERGVTLSGGRQSLGWRHPWLSLSSKDHTNFSLFIESTFRSEAACISCSCCLRPSRSCLDG
jgi:ATP-binding cassette subfamily C (CFTR/MRP) protein 1